MSRTGWVLLLLSGTLASPVAAHRGQGNDEKRLEASVRDALERSGVDSDAVRVKVRGRVVFLSGDVRTARDKLRAIQAAFSISEVEEVESGLEVRSGGTPDLEEQIWLSLLQEGLDSFVFEVLVKEGVASVRGEVPDPATRERVLAVARGIPGVASVRDEIVLPAASEANPKREPPVEVSSPPEPPPEVEAPPEAEEPREVAAEAEPPAALPPPPPLPEPPRDIPASAPDLAQRIVPQILSYRGYTVFDQVQFSLDGADVTLTGAVTEATKKQEIEERVRSVPGIGKLDNQLRVLPSSKTDEKLRESLFRRIYEDSMFAEFAGHANPPIHIIVESGRVTLTGVVDSVIARMSAEAMVRTAFGVAGVSNQLRVRQ
jgi:hyperosmotically inducible protein